MAYSFREKSLLVVNNDNHSRRLLVGMLKVLAIQDVDEAYECSDALRKIQDKQYDAVIGDIVSGNGDVIDLARRVRADGSISNPHIPILAICGQRALNFVDAAREAGVSELVRVPYSSQIIAEVLNYAFSLDEEKMEYYATSQKAPEIEAQTEAVEEPSIDDEEGFSITNMLLDHYIKHNEIVLAKLKFAQSATQTCISQLRETYSKVKDEDNTTIDKFTDFDQMWEEIITMFLKGGLSEEDIFSIEKKVLAIPPEIKTHYDDLSVQDKSFMSLLESINSNAYARAKSKVMQLHQTPNPLNGKTIDNYEVKKVDDDNDEKEFQTMIVDPRTVPKNITRS